MQHVPFESRQREVVYITDSPDPRAVRRSRSNGFGVAGFVLSLMGFFTCGVLSPLGLLFSVLGMFRAPRGLATAGMVMGLVGTGAIGMFLTAVSHESHHHEDSAIRHYEVHRTSERINQAKQEIEQFRLEHEGRMPEGVDGNKMIVVIEDGWHTSLGYEPDDNGYVIRSAGPDQVFDTYDDVTSRVAITDARMEGLVSFDESIELVPQEDASADATAEAESATEAEASSETGGDSADEADETLAEEPLVEEDVEPSAADGRRTLK